MALYRMQVSVERGADIDIDDCVNTFYLQDIGPTSNPEQLTTDSANLWATIRTYPLGTTGIRARCYNMDHPKPRLPIATKFASVTAGSSAGPREVALCLSFYATLNAPRRRGRLYIGPFIGGETSNERPTSGLQTTLKNLAIGIGNLGGVDVDWMQYSPTNGVLNKVTNYWIDNEWDTVRSRGLKGTTRVTGTTQE